MARKKKELDRFDSTAKRDVPIVVKLLSVIFSAVVLSVAGVTALSLNIFSSGFRDATDEDLMNFSQGLDMTLKDWRSTLESDVMMLSNRPDISPMINSSNAHDLNAIVGWANGTLSVDVLAFTDSFGKVVGTVVAAYSLINGNIVNQVAKSYSAACTIFKGYMRVSSTLGDKYIGTSLDNTTITDAVIKDGNEYHGTNIIDGHEYMSVYFPLESSNGVISGMAFIARSVEIVNRTRNNTMKIVIPCAAIFVLLFVLFCYRFVHWLMIRIYNVTNFLKELETGDADLTKRCKLFLRDEIGDLIIHFDLFLDKLQEIMGEIKDTKNELGESGKKLSVGTQETANAITQIIENIDGIHNQITAQAESVSTTADVVKDISENITNLDILVDNQTAGVTQAAASVEEMIGNISSVNEMSAGADRINETGTALAAISGDVQGAINKIGSQIDLFKTE